jgi:ABC-2 type transport system permease protein
MSTLALNLSTGFWRRTGAMLIKEFIQLRRDRVSFAMIVMIPVMQLMLFGYAINTTPRHMPTAVLLQEQSDAGRSILKAIENTAYFNVIRQARDAAEFDQLLKSGTVLFGIEVPAEFERSLRRGDRPALLFAADATDPVAAGTAMGSLNQVIESALINDHAIPDATASAFEIRAHASCNPAASTASISCPA